MDGHPDDEQIARRAHSAIAAQDWAGLRMLLHPYMRWTGSDGVTIRGRTQVIAALQRAAATPSAPVSVEIRDGQIYRWRA